MITEDKIKERVLEMFLDRREEWIDKKIRRILNSGSVDLGSFNDDYELPKYILCALLKELEWQYRPLTNYGRKYSDNIYRML